MDTKQQLINRLQSTLARVAPDFIYIGRDEQRLVLESLTSNFEYGVTFYNAYDDGSHPYGDFNLRFDTPQEAHDHGKKTVEAEWQQRRADYAERDAADLDWFDRAVERNTYVVECYEKGDKK